MRTLTDLNLVQWHLLEHAYGEAADVPDLLRALDDDEETFGDLLGALCHQGTRYSASAAAVPYVAGLAHHPALTTSVLVTLGYLAIGEDDVHTFPQSFEAQGIGDPASLEAYRMVEAEVPGLLQYVAHADPLTSAAAVWLVSWFPALASQTLPVVRTAAPSITTTLARGLLGDREILPPDGPSGWPEAVAAMCVDSSALDSVLAFARSMREPALSGAFTPYLSGDVAYILAGALKLAPASRLEEAHSAIRVLGDRVKGARASVLYGLIEPGNRP